MISNIAKSHKLVCGCENMEIETKEKGAMPDYKGDGVAVWIKEDKNGNKYLSICVANSINVVAFKYEPKPKK